MCHGEVFENLFQNSAVYQTEFDQLGSGVALSMGVDRALLISLLAIEAFGIFCSAER